VYRRGPQTRPLPLPHRSELVIGLSLGTANGKSVAESASMPPEGTCFSGAMHGLFAIADVAGTPIGGAMTWAPSRASAIRALRQMDDRRPPRLGNKQRSSVRHRQDHPQSVVGPDRGAMPGVSLVAPEVADSSAAGAEPLGMYPLGLAGTYHALGVPGLHRVEPSSIYTSEPGTHRLAGNAIANAGPCAAEWRPGAKTWKAQRRGSYDS